MTFTNVITRYGSWLPMRPLHRGLYAGAAIIMAVAALVTYYSIGTLVETSRWVKHTHEVTYALEEIMLSIASAEANHRGYLITGHEDFLQRLQRARMQAWASVARAEELTRDNAEQQARLPPLRAALLAKFDDMQAVVDQLGKHVADAGAIRVPTDRGARATEDIERQIAVMRTVEGDLLAARMNAAERARLAAAVSAAATGLVGLTLLLMLGYITERDRRRMQLEIGERRRAEEMVRELATDLEQRVLDRTRQLSEANIELDAFSYTIAHDLRAPLRNIHELGTALKEDYAASLPGEALEYLARMQSAAVRMDALISDLLDYARLGREEVRMGPVEIAACVEKALQEVAIDIAARDAQVEVMRPLGRVLAQRTMVQQVLLNLITNALKFVGKGSRPRMRVYAEDKGDRWRVCVEDNGIGVDSRHAERIFHVFERLHGQEAYPGTGVGLAIVKKGIEGMGGHVGLEPASTGSRFWFELKKA